MSTVQKISPFNGQEYPVGVEDYFVGSKGNKDISTVDLIWPIYGAWAGPSWSGNNRVSKKRKGVKSLLGSCRDILS